MSNNNNHHSEQRNSLDPYAGQYPPPPPLPKQDLSVDENLNQPFYVLDRSIRQSQPSQHNRQSFHGSEHSQYSNKQSFHGSEPSSHRKSSFPDENSAHISITSNHTIPEYINNNNNNNNRGHYYETNSINNNNNTTEDNYYDPEAVNLKDYLYAERQEKLRKQTQEQPEHYTNQQSDHYNIQQQPEYYNQQQEYYSQQPERYNPQQQQQEIYNPQDHIYNRPEHPFRSEQHGYAPSDEDLYRHALPRPEPMYYSNTQPFRKSEELYPSPMMMPPPLFNQPQQRNSALFSPSGQPNFVPPPPPPPPPFGMMRPQPIVMNSDMYPKQRGCCCFGISFCSCLSMIFLTLILLAGVALIISTKILGDKCTSNQYKESHATVCGQVLHDGFLYGGIVIAGLSGLIIVWRMIRWCGHSPPS